jgi:hypothetical protein
LEVTAVLTNEDFQALGQMMDEKLGRLIDDKVGKLIDDKVARLIDDKVAKLIDDKVARLIDDKVGRLIDDKLSPILIRLEENEKSISRVNRSVVLLEKEVKHDFKIICENSGNWSERNRQIDLLQKTQEEHHDRIWALEQVVKASNQ